MSFSYSVELKSQPAFKALCQFTSQHRIVSLGFNFHWRRILETLNALEGHMKMVQNMTKKKKTDEKEKKGASVSGTV